MKKVNPEETHAVARIKEAHKTHTWFYWRSYGNDWTPFCIQKLYSKTIEKKEIGFKFYLN